VYVILNFAAMTSVDLKRVQRIGYIKRRMAKTTVDCKGVKKVQKILSRKPEPVINWMWMAREINCFKETRIYVELIQVKKNGGSSLQRY
jgi:hypothetical protein